MPDLPETTYAVLGLVDKLPRSSGYDLAAVAARSLAYFWPVSKTLLYRELRRLDELGWVAVERVAQERVPDKWVYTATGPGRDALDAWLRSAPPEPTPGRDPHLLRLFFGHRLSAADRAAVVEAYRHALTLRRDSLQVVADKLAPQQRPEAWFGRQGALQGLRTTEAQLAWLAELEVELAERGSP